MEKRIPYNEFSNDIEYMPSMDSAWHYWLQPKYKDAKREWDKKFSPGQKSGQIVPIVGEVESKSGKITTNKQKELQ